MAIILDCRALQSPLGAVNTLGDLLALLVTSANEQARGQVQQLNQKVQEVTGERGGYTLLL